MHVSNADNVATPQTMPSHSNRTRKRRESLSHLSSGLRHYGAKTFCENCAKTTYAKIARKHLRPPPFQGTDAVDIIVPRPVHLCVPTLCETMRVDVFI
jgi:hypothetical protein